MDAVKLADNATSFKSLFNSIGDISGSIGTLSAKFGGAGAGAGVMSSLTGMFDAQSIKTFGESAKGFNDFKKVSAGLGKTLSNDFLDVGTLTSIMKGFPDGVMTSVLKNMDVADANKILKKMEPGDAAEIFKKIDVEDTASMLKNLDNPSATKIINKMDLSDAAKADLAKKMGKTWDAKTMTLVAAATVTIGVGAGLIGKAEEERKKAIKECKEQCIPEGWGTGPSPELKYKKLDESDHGIVCTPKQDDCEKYCDDECNEKYKDFGSAGLGDDVKDFFKKLNPLEWFKDMKDWVAWFLRIFICIISFLLVGGCFIMLIKTFT